MTDNLNVNIHKVQLLQKSRNTDNAMLVFSGSRSLFNKNENIYDEESDHSNKAVRKTPEIESGHKVSEEVK